MLPKTANRSLYKAPPDTGNVENQVKISYLINAVYWFIENVFIVRDENGCRLVTIHQGRLLVDKNYKNVKSARIAFTRFFKNKTWKKEIKPFWSPFYTPNPEWLKQKFEILKR